MATRLLLDAWDILGEVARSTGKITYSKLAERLTKLGHRVIARNMGQRVLDPLFDTVTNPNDYPVISALVVRKDRGYPGDGWWGSGEPVDLKEWKDELEWCWAFNWPKVPPGIS